jgi:transposase
MGYSHQKISLEINAGKSTVTSMIKRMQQNQGDPWSKTKRIRPPSMLSERAQWRLVRFMGANPFETISSMSTPSKSGYWMHLNSTRKYLAKGEYYAFKPRKKPFLKPEHKKVRLLWVHLMKDLSLEDWALFAFSDEATFEIGLDTRPAWVCRK